MIFMDVSTIAPRDEFDDRLQVLIREIHSAPTATGVDQVLLPGEREWEHRRKAQVEGIALPADVLSKLTEAANLVELSPNWLT